MASKPAKRPRLVNTNRKAILAQREPAYFNPRSHDRNTKVNRFVWTSEADLSTGLKTGWRPQKSGQFVSARATLQGAGSSDSKFDIFLDEFSIFDTGGIVIVPSGETQGYRKPITRHIYFQADGLLQVNVDTVGTGATGPAVVEITYRMGF